MSGSVETGKKAAATNRARHGKDFYRRIGAKGGQWRGEKGFASWAVGKDGLVGRERARVAGAIGGRAPRHTKKRAAA